MSHIRWGSRTSRAGVPSARHRDTPLARHRLRPCAERLRRPPKRHRLGAGFHLSKELPIHTSIPRDEQGKAFIAIFNLLLVSCRDESGPSHLHALTAPSRLSRAVPAATQTLGRRARSAYICRNAGFGHLEPRQRPVFSCPMRSEPPRGPVVCTCGKSHHSTSHCSTYYPAMVSTTARAVTHQ